MSLSKQNQQRISDEPDDLRKVDLANKYLELDGWTRAWEQLLHNKSNEGEGNQKLWHLSRWSYSEGYKKGAANEREEFLAWLRSLWTSNDNVLTEVKKKIKELEHE